jgi:tight adherence protein B
MLFYILIIILVLIFVAIVCVYVSSSDSYTREGYQKNMAVSENLRTMVSQQRALLRDGDRGGSKGERTNIATAAAAETGLNRTELQKSYELTLADRLKFGQLIVPTTQIRMTQGIVSFVSFLSVLLVGSLIGPSYIIAGLTLILGPFWVIDYVNYRMDKRSAAFEKDYASFLMSFVSLLKSGLTTIGALETAGKSLDEDSLIRAEIELVIQRIKMGLSEEQALGQFGEDIYHPEIEMFLEAIILSKKLGGNLSSTVERLAKQVRKRSQFKSQAMAAVGMEKGSLKAIALIMSCLLIYMCYTAPDLVLPALTDPTGWMVMQVAICIITIGFYWSKSVANLKV